MNYWQRKARMCGTWAIARQMCKLGYSLEFTLQMLVGRRIHDG